MHPTILRGAIAGRGKPALITHHQFVIQRGGVHPGGQAEEQRLAGQTQNHLVGAVADGDAVGHSLPEGGSSKIRSRLQHVVNGRGWPGKHEIGVYQFDGWNSDKISDWPYTWSGGDRCCSAIEKVAHCARSAIASDLATA